MIGSWTLTLMAIATIFATDMLHGSSVRRTMWAIVAMIVAMIAMIVAMIVVLALRLVLQVQRPDLLVVSGVTLALVTLGLVSPSGIVGQFAAMATVCGPANTPGGSSLSYITTVSSCRTIGAPSMPCW